MSPRAAFALAVAVAAGRASALELYVPELQPPTRPAELHSDDGDRSFTDLRLSVTAGIASGYTADIRPIVGDGHLAQSGDWRGTFALHADVVRSRGLAPWGGLVWSMGADFSRSQSDLVGPDSTLLLVSVSGALGYAIPFGRHVQLELLPFASFGGALLDDHLKGAAPDAANGWALAVGGRASLAVTLDSGLQLAATGGYSATWLDLSRESYYRVAIESRGFSAGAIVGKRF
jgi:hypothetical protein